MPSFDTVIEPDLVEMRNAVEQATKEIGTRFDFKGSSAAVELADRSAKDRELTLFGDSDFQLQQVRDVLLARLAKRSVDVRFLDFSGKPVKLGGDKLGSIMDSAAAADPAKAGGFLDRLKGMGKLGAFVDKLLGVGKTILAVARKVGGILMNLGEVMDLVNAVKAVSAAARALWADGEAFVDSWSLATVWSPPADMPQVWM